MQAQENAKEKVFLDLDKLFELYCCSAGTGKGLWLYGSTMITNVSSLEVKLFMSRVHLLVVL